MWDYISEQMRCLWGVCPPAWAVLAGLYYMVSAIARWLRGER